MARINRNVRKTLLIVGEGDTEVAFLKHLRNLYCANQAGTEATIRNAHGKNPQHVIETVIGQSRSMAYDTRAALLDTDVPWSTFVQKLIRTNKICAVGARPCIEGLLLTILGHNAPQSTAQCKVAVASALAFDLLNWRSYATHFSKERLEQVRTTQPELDLLLECFEGKRLKV